MIFNEELSMTRRWFLYHIGKSKACNDRFGEVTLSTLYNDWEAFLDKEESFVLHQKKKQAELNENKFMQEQRSQSMQGSEGTSDLPRPSP